MRGVTSKETHFQSVIPPSYLAVLYISLRIGQNKSSNIFWCFSVTITSPEFATKPQPARHRMVYALLKEEMAREGGIHALQLTTRTPEEEERIAARQQEQTQ